MKELALMGGKPLIEKTDYQWPISGQDELENLASVLNSGKWSRFASFEQRFSKEFAKFQGGEYAVCTTSGMVALFCALKVLKVNPGDEVIVPAFPQPPALSICYDGAIPIFVDINKENYCIDPDKVREAITKNTKAIIVIHTHNTVADMDSIMKISREYNIPVIEDCAHGHGVKCRDNGVGYIGDIGIFSFEQSKAMTSGEGGIITTNNKHYYQDLVALINLGRGPDNKKNKKIIGWNFRMSEFHAAVLMAQLNRFPSQLEEKVKNIALFESLLDEMNGIDYIHQDKRISRSGGFLFTLKYNSRFFDLIPLSIFAKALRAEGVLVRTRDLSYNSPEVVNYLRKENIKPYCPNADIVVKEVLLTIPHHVFLGNVDDIHNIFNAILKVKNNIKELKGYSIASKVKSKLLNIISI